MMLLRFLKNMKRTPKHKHILKVANKWLKWTSVFSGIVAIRLVKHDEFTNFGLKPHNSMINVRSFSTGGIGRRGVSGIDFLKTKLKLQKSKIRKVSTHD